jgi:hypothetical protein
MQNDRAPVVASSVISRVAEICRTRATSSTPLVLFSLWTDARYIPLILLRYSFNQTQPFDLLE